MGGEDWGMIIPINICLYLLSWKFAGFHDWSNSRGLPFVSGIFPSHKNAKMSHPSSEGASSAPHAISGQQIFPIPTNTPHFQPHRTPNSTPSLKTNWWNYTTPRRLRSGVAKIQNPPMAGGTKRLGRRKEMSLPITS